MGARVQDDGVRESEGRGNGRRAVCGEEHSRQAFLFVMTAACGVSRRLGSGAHASFSSFPTSHAAASLPTAQQEAERAKYIVSKASQDKEAIIIKAEGEAQSAALVGQVQHTHSPQPTTQECRDSTTRRPST